MGFPTLACMELTSEEARKQSLKLVKEVSLSISWKMESFPANEMYTLSWMLRGQGRTQYTRLLTCCMLQPPGTLLLLCSQVNLGSEGLTYKEEGLKSAHRGQLAATRPNLPAFVFNFSQQHKTESWLITGVGCWGGASPQFLHRLWHSWEHRDCWERWDQILSAHEREAWSKSHNHTGLHMHTR